MNRKKAESNTEEEGFAPVPFISKISFDGIVEISFSVDVYIVPNVTILNNGTIEIDEEVYPVLQIEVESGGITDQKRLNFTWEVVKQTARKLYLQLHFHDPIFVSANPERDLFKATFRDP